jgi:hypothetical protein
VLTALQESTVKRPHQDSLATVMKVTFARAVKELRHQLVLLTFWIIQMQSQVLAQSDTTAPTVAATLGSAHQVNTRTRLVNLIALSAMRATTALKQVFQHLLARALLVFTVSKALNTINLSISQVDVFVHKATTV